MANEATRVYDLGEAIPFKVADGTAIPKGTLLKMSDPLTAAKSGSGNDIIAGIAASEKEANDGKTKLGVYSRGIFKMTADGSITVGDMLESNAGTTENTVVTVSESAGSKSNVVGRALESAEDGDTLLVELNPMQVEYP